MKIKNLLLSVSVLTAFALSAFVNASPNAVAYLDTTGSGDPTGISCIMSTGQQANSVTDGTDDNYTCGSCTVYTINVGWATGFGAKYAKTAQTAKGVVIKCKSSSSSTTACTFTMTTNVTVNCPPAPADANATGTGPIKTGTGS